MCGFWRYLDLSLPHSPLSLAPHPPSSRPAFTASLTPVQASSLSEKRHPDTGDANGSVRLLLKPGELLSLLLPVSFSAVALSPSLLSS